MTEKSCSEEGDDPKGKRAAAAVFTEEQEMKLLDFLKENKLLCNQHLMNYKDPNKQEALWDAFCAENKMNKDTCMQTLV